MRAAARAALQYVCFAAHSAADVATKLELGLAWVPKGLLRSILDKESVDDVNRQINESHKILDTAKLCLGRCLAQQI